MGCGGWRIIFTVNDLQVLIEQVVPGYPDSLLSNADNTQIPDQDAQIAFKLIWPDEDKE
jgi:hypothetical protein